MENASNVYVSLIEVDGNLVWNFAKLLPVGVILDAADNLKDVARQQQIGPAPVPPMPDEEETD